MSGYAELEISTQARFVSLGLSMQDLPKTGEAARHADFTDVELTLAKDLQVEDILAERESAIPRLFAFFLRLTALAREDERLQSILDDYEIRIGRGFGTDREAIYP